MNSASFVRFNKNAKNGFYPNMKTTALRALLLVALACNPPALHADVTIASPMGGNNLSADKALNSTNGPAFTALGNIVITEGLTTDFDSGADQTFILTAPPGWQFKAGTGTVTFTGSRDITAASIAVTASDATITFTTSGTAQLDVMTIGGLQVQALDGANAPADYIRCSFDNPGTAYIAGIEQDYTMFGLLNQIPGVARALALQAQPGSSVNVGVLFAPQPTVNVVDQFGTLRNMDNTTVVTASRAAGSGTLQGSLSSTAVFGTATFSNLSMNTAGTITIQFSATNCTGVVSQPIAITVVPVPASRVIFSTQPGAAIAGAPFGVQPVLKTADAQGNFTSLGLANHQYVTLALLSGSGTLLGTTTQDLGTSGGNGIVNFSDLEMDAAGTNWQLVASSPGFVNTTSSVFAVTAGPLTRLQLLLPGETAAPGTATGKLGTPSAQTASTAFNVTVKAVDAFYNLVNTATDIVAISSLDTSATLPANAALVNGTKILSVTLKTASSATITATDISNPSKPGSTSPMIAVNSGAFAKLQILIPGETAAPGTASGKIGTPAVQTAGTSFNVIVNAVDANWNLTGNATDIVGLISSDANARLPVNTSLVGGTATLTVTPLTAGNATFTAKNISDVSKASNISPSLTVGAGPFSQLQLLVPGETAAPGTATGKSGSPVQQMTGESFAVIANAVDANWNKVATATDLVSLTSSDASAILPADTTLAAGSQTWNVMLNTVGSATLTATDVSSASKTSATSPAIPVALSSYSAATGGSAISADTTGGTYTALTGPVYTEAVAGNVGLGTIILKAPAGFVFNTVSPLPTVLINGNGGKTNINGVVNGTAASLSSVTTNQLVFTITKKSSGGFPCKLTWQNVKVRPSAGTPLATGKLSFAGTASLVGASTNSNLGLLQEVVGVAAKFAIQTQPSAAATAGVAFAQQPVLQILDRFGNFRANDSTTMVTASRSAGSGVLQGMTARTASSGIVTFNDLSHNFATNITVVFTSPGVTNLTSSVVAVGANVATILAFSVQPGNATAGSVFGTQPVIVTQDSFGNNSTNGLAESQNIQIAMNAGSGPLQGTTGADIGTTMGKGRVAFTDLRIDAAGAGQQLKATGNGLLNGNSSLFAVNAGPPNQIVIQNQPSSAAQAGVIFPQQPVVLVEDVFGNLRTSDNTTIVTVARNAGTGVLLCTKTATASGGIARFSNLSYTNLQTIDLKFSSGSLPVVISSSINVGPGAARKLRILSQPSSTAKAGQLFAQQPLLRLEDQYGNVCTNDSITVVTASRNTGTGTLRGTTNVTASAGLVSFTDLSYPKAETTSILFKGGTATNATSTNIVVSAGAFSKLLLLAPGETAAPGTINGKTGTLTNQGPDTAFNVTVRAVDDNWNLVSTATDVIGFTSSDLVATMPTNSALVAGAKQFSVKLSESGATNTITASDLTDSSKPSFISAIGVSARYISATGGKAIPASTAGGAFTTLVGPVYSEKVAAEVGKGTIILSAPTGFAFDTSAPAPTVKIETITPGAKSPANINGVTNGAVVAMTSVSSTQLVFTVNTTSLANTCKLTWQNVRVRPTASSPLAIGKITKSGTSIMAGVSNGISNLGTLVEIQDVAPAMAPLSAVESAPASQASTGFPENKSTAGSSGDNLGIASAVSVTTPVTITSINAAGGTISLTFTGAPNQTYQIHRAPALQLGLIDWTSIGSATTDAAGQGQFTDSNPPLGQGFYRTSSH